MSALRYVGCPVAPSDEFMFNSDWGWNIIRAANELHPTQKAFTEATFWQSIKRDFWATVPKSRECDWLLETCAGLVGRENVCILSSPTLDPDCASGKVEWIYTFMPQWMHRQFLIGPRKHFCARPDSLLIDDRDKNIEDFCAAGGCGITMPRPWNRLHHYEEPIVYVRSCLDYAFGTQWDK
jgi:hypothetical protein